MSESEITDIVLDLAFKIHKKLGPGLFESVYEEILAFELKKCRLNFERQKPIPVTWDHIKMELGFRSDLIVENKVIVEIKSIEAINPIHPKQVLTYLRLTNLKLGLLINFNEPLLKDGIKRVANKL